MRQSAQAGVSRAAAIIDGEVIRPFTPGRQNASVLSYCVLKGPRQNIIKVGEQYSCSIALSKRGERSRMLLIGGPEVYYLHIDQSCAAYEDRLLNSDREKKLAL